MTTEQTLILLLAVAGFVVENFVRTHYRHEFIVTDGFAGLLYHVGKRKAPVEIRLRRGDAASQPSTQPPT